MENHSSDKNNGFYVSKKQFFFCILFSVLGCVFVAWLSHYFTMKSLLEDDSVLVSHVNACNSLYEVEYEDDARPHGSSMDKIPKKEKMRNVRLPKSIVPDRYEIKLIPFIMENNFTFRGEVKILLNVTEDTSNVTLHANDLEIEPESVRLMDLESGNAIGVRSLSNDSETQFFVTHAEEDLRMGRQYQIEMKFLGHLNDELQGFYRSSYTVGNTKRFLLCF